MLYLISRLWVFAISVLLLGIALGWTATASLAKVRHKPVVSHDGKATGLERFILLFAGIFVVGILVAILEILGGVIGLWWDVVMLLVAALVLGCVVGSLARRWPFEVGRLGARSVAAQSSLEIPMMYQTVTSESVIAPATESAAVDTRQEQPAPRPAPFQPSLSSPFSTAPILWAMPAGEAEPIVVAPALARSASRPTAPDSEDQKIVSARPPGLSEPEAGLRDDLKRIRGIGPVSERKLNELGIYHFAQIAQWQVEQVEWVNGHLAFSGRIQREDWIGQAKELAFNSDKKPKKRARNKAQSADEA